MSRCPHTMKAEDRDGTVYCCDCGKTYAARAEAALTKAQSKRLRLIAAAPRQYMAGGTLNASLERIGCVQRSGDGLWVELSITPAGRSALAALEGGEQP